MRKITYLLAFIALVSLACTVSGTENPTPTLDVSDIVEQTLAAYTAAAAQTQVAESGTQAAQTLAAYTQLAQTPLPSPSETPPPPPQATETPVPPPPTNTLPPPPQENAPDPLPAMNTGIILDNGQCFNFDNGQITTPDAQCDVWLMDNGAFRQLNGAQISGYVTFDPPTRSHCASARYEPGDLAVQTDLYMCVTTNEGQYGFIVVRDYRGGIPATGIVFDYWVFR